MSAQRLKLLPASALVCAMLTSPAPACELCAIYNANNARADAGRGFIFTIAEQYVSQHNLQLEGTSVSGFPFYNAAYMDSSYIHFVPGYNFSSRFGVSMNAPLIHRDFHLTQQASPSGATFDERGSLTGLGDIALIGRVGLIQKVKMTSALNVSLLAGVKFPTGDTDRLDDEVSLAKIDLANYGPGHQHGLTGGIHQHDLSLGSGSYDGIFGLTTDFRWKRWFVNAQFQYNLRTEGHDYEFGDLMIISGGPGMYVPLGEQSTLSLQAKLFYETSPRDEIIGQRFDQTGMTAWYLGPLISFTFGEHFSAFAGVDVPLHWRIFHENFRVYNHGLQTVPDYRVEAGLTWRF